MVSSDQCVFSPGDDKGFPPPDDHLEKINGETAEVVKVIDKEQVTRKKPRFIWTRDMHNRFLDAVKQLGFHKAVPTKILELMNVEDLNRENVASHLQKYRIQVKRRAQARAQERASSSNAPQAVYPHIPQQPRALPNTMQSINMECTCLDRSRLAPSFLNPNLNLIQGASTSQEVYGTTNFLVEGVDRMRSLRLLRGCLDSNGPYDINNIGYNSGQLPPKPLVDSYAPRRLIDRHDMPLVPQFDRFYDPFAPQYDQLDESYIGSIIGPSFVPQYDQRNELYHQPSFAPQYGQHGESFVAGQGIVSPSLAQNMEGFGVGGVPHTPEAAVGGLTGIVMKVGGIEPGMSQPPTGHVPLQPEETEGIAGMTDEEGQAQHLSEATGDHLPYQTEAHAGMKVEVTQVPEPTEGVGVGVPPPAEETGGLTYRNDFQQGFSFNGESSLDYNDIWLNMKEDVDGKSFDELFR